MASIRKRNDKWQVQIRQKGHAPISRSFRLKRDAEVWARQTETRIDRNELPDDPRILDRLTLGYIVKRYIQTFTLRKRTSEGESYFLNAFLRHPICTRRLSELTTAHFAAYRDERLQEIKPASLKRQLDPIRNMFEVARDEWGIPIRENPLAKLSMPPINNRRERRLRNGELQRLIEAAKTRKNPLIAPIIKFAVETAMRRGEILAMRWVHIDWKQRSLLIPHTKNGYVRTIPLTPAAYGLLDSCRREGDLVFSITGNALRLSWERVKKKAEIDDLHFHDLRHEAISRFFEMGLTTPEVALISGHRDMRMLFRYTHPLRSQISEKLDKEHSRHSVR